MIMRKLPRIFLILAATLAIPGTSLTKPIEDSRVSTYNQNKKGPAGKTFFYTGGNDPEDNCYKNEELRTQNNQQASKCGPPAANNSQNGSGGGGAGGNATLPALVFGSQPSKAMPHKTTPLFSTTQLNEWYMSSMQNPDKAEAEGMEDWILENRAKLKSGISEESPYKTAPYLGPLYKGQNNVMRLNQRLFQPSNAGWSEDDPDGKDDEEGQKADAKGSGSTKKTDKKKSSSASAQQGSSVRTCKPMLKPEGNLQRPAEYNPDYLRLEMDNCMNQYILRQNSRFTNMIVEKQSPINGLTSKSCQPLKMKDVQPNEREYAADWYLKNAWEKLLKDPKTSARDGMAAGEPDYTKMKVKIASNGKIELPKNFGKTEVTDIGDSDMQVERILDPSHPFSPRWDYETNERDKFSPLTIVYSKDPKNAVRCSGEKDTNIIKVDIMSFRKDRFTKHIMSRIGWNIACYTNPGCRQEIWIPRGCTADAPCCSTRWNQNDKVPTPWCTMAAGSESGLKASQLCEWLAKPVVPINALKMRKGNNTNFPTGVPEGYSFKSYFGNHRPYMRTWDTGQEAGSNQAKSYADVALKTDGSDYAIQGAGREGQNCAIGGGKGRGGIPGVSPITSWMELKQYQVNAIRNGLFCLPRNDVLNKTGGSEDYALRQTGAVPQLKFEDENGKQNRIRSTPWPMAWRGYVMDTNDKTRFPKFGSKNEPKLIKDLSKALPGDIAIFGPDIMMEKGKDRKDNEYDKDDTWRMPYIAFVQGGDNEQARTQGASSSGGGGSSGGSSDAPQSLKLIALNHGKFPDACGNTSDQGMGETFTVYKDKLPDYLDKRFDKLDGKYTKKCNDPALSNCIEPLWSKVSLYRPSEDNRSDD